MSKNKSKAKTLDKIEQSNYINQIIGAKNTQEDPQLDSKIESVQTITNWPREDIKRVLEECNYDTQKAISNILDGIAGKPNKEWTVVSKRSAKENKEHRPPREKGRKSNSVNFQRAQGERGSRPPKNNANSDNTHASNSGPTRPQESQPSPKEQVTDAKVGEAQKPNVGQRRAPEQPNPNAPQQPSVPAQPQKSNAQGPPAQTLAQVVATQSQKSAQQAPTPTPAQPSNNNSSAPPVAQAQQAQQTTSPSSSYRPNMVWKPKQEAQTSQQAPQTSSQNLTATQQPQTISQTQNAPNPSSSVPPSTKANVATVTQTQPSPTLERPTQTQQQVQPQVQQPQTQQASTTSTPNSSVQVQTPVNQTANSQTTFSSNTLYSSPVVLPAKTAIDAIPEFNFGTFNISQDYEHTQYSVNDLNTVQSKSNTTASNQNQTYIDSPSNERNVDHLRNMGQYMAAPSPIEAESHPQLHPSYAAYGLPPTPFMPSVFPHYYETSADGRPVMVYDQTFQPPFQREPSPSESSKFANTQRVSNSNQPNYRDPKYGSQDASTGQPQTTSPQPNQSQQPTSQAQHFPYGGPLYGYPPYMPNQYASYQTAQSGFYRHPYIARGYPNYSTNSTAFPPTAATSGSPLGTAYPTPDDMQLQGLGQEYKNITFPPMNNVGSFFPSPADMQSMMGNKNPQQQVGQQQVSTSGKSQYAQPSPTTSTSDISGNAYKPSGQQSGYQQASSNSFYNLQGPQQFPQTNQASNYSYVQMQQAPYSRQNY